MVFDYDVLPPYLTYGVMSADGRMVHRTDIDLPGPAAAPRPRDHRAPHDLPGLPADVGPGAAGPGQDAGDVRADMPARFGVLGRHADGDAVRWFEAEPCYMYHTINAWEAGDEIVLVGCRIENPLAERPTTTTPCRASTCCGSSRTCTSGASTS